ncbi:bacteriohemerythrin [Dyella solisilvae]|uniref:Bacteriohemerythrin n=1 Tax=Dyella solisilvae TaxID=1920168 RepID=A0A370K5A8_9GAMM|nr:bacteriohemerythrin [Dyella solisilvae]RDI97200.1 bacteriohemerythrin [Dyella solisilvae]
MPYMTWQDDLNTGIKVIDNQHRRIVEMINHLHEAMNHSGHQELNDILDELVDYTLSHFTFEESLMEDAGYEFTRAHKRVHEVFVKRVSEYRLRFRAGEDIGQELMHTLSHWLFNHIRNDDKAIVDAVRRHMQDVSQDDGSSGGWLARSLKRFFGGRH